MQGGSEAFGGPMLEADHPQRVARRSWWRQPATALVAVLIVAGGGGFALARTLTPDPAAATGIKLVQNDARPPAGPFTKTIAKDLPSVVNIHVTELASSPLGGVRQARAEGSGIVLSRNGVIVTNNHVVAGATRVTVTFPSGNHHALPGTVVGTDPSHDLAVVRVAAHDLHPIRLGRSSRLALGDPVVTIGYPLNLGGPTVTQGIISGLHRSITASGGSGGSEHLTDLIQTDAAINPGNSGGALIDAAGDLVGINTAAASASSAENTGFAIPIDDAIPVVRQILSHRQQQQAWLGVEVGPVTPGAAAQLGAGTRGALVAAVIPGSPAASAGVRRGDVIVAVDGKAVRSPSALTRILAGHHPGQRVDVTVRRGSARVSLGVTLGRRPATLPG